MKIEYNITQNKFNVSFKTGYYPLPVGLENYYTKNETDLLLENYYLKTETYSQNEVDSLFSNETLDAITDRGNTTENDIKVGGLTTNYVQLDTTSVNTYNIGKVYWNSDKGTYNFGLLNNVELQLGQEQYVYGKAYSAISNGQLVMYRTSQGGHILFEPANFTQLSTNPDLIIGVATQDIALNDFGYITTFGEVNTLNTSSFADGDTLYFGSGNVLQNTAPTGIYFIIGRVNRSHATQGSIFVKPYFVDGNLESKSNKSDSYTASSSTTYASTKALVEGLATKADLAVVDNLQIGGRNLVLNSKGDFNIESNDGYSVMLEKGQSFTWSLEVKSSVNGNISIYFLDNVIGSFAIKSVTLTTEFTKHSENGICPSWWTIESGTLFVYNPNSLPITIRKVKVEKGNKATDWTPAPEDQISDWNQINETAFNFIKNKPIDDISKGVQAFNWGNHASQAYLKSSDFNIQNYYTKNEALNLFVGLNGVQTIYDTKTFSSSPVVPNGTIENHAVNLGQLNEKVNNIQIGGRNLILNSEQPTWNANNTGLGTSVKMEDATGKFTRTTPDAGKYVSVFGQYYAYFESGKFSRSMYVRHFHTSNINIWGQSIPPNVWTWIKEEAYLEYSGWNGYDTDTINVAIDTKKFKLEKGNKATDWTPAPEDKQDRLQDITGNIGVGKTDASATEKLDVNGNIKATQFKDVNGNLKSQRTITITGNTTLSEIHNGAVLDVTNTCNITIPTGLDANFQCVIFAKGSVIVTFVNGGVTVYAPSGLLLKTDKMASLISTSANNFNLTGELATS